MKILIDMNLSPAWRAVFVKEGWTARHWSEIGHPSAPDKEILDWAKINGYVVFTNDLDFGAILAATNAQAPSVVQIRTQDLTPDAAGPAVIRGIRSLRKMIEERSVLITFDESSTRARILPIRGGDVAP